MNRLVAYGYGVGQHAKITVKLPPIKVSMKTTMSRSRWFEPTETPVVMVSTGPTVIGAALPHVNPKDDALSQGGADKRFGYDPPQHCRAKRRRFSRFVKKWLTRFMTPLTPECDTTLDTWLAQTNYPEWRKQQLREVWEKHGPDADFLGKEKQLKICKSFPKDETYGEFKFTRLINARHDWFKCFSGPIFKLIEKQLFAMPWFIKKIPVADRPKYIKDVLEGCAYAIATDYTSFEALFTRDMMDDCEFQLYKYMTGSLPERGKMDKIINALEGKNHCVFKNFKVELKATRMSGEMCTSLGNSFSNLMFMLFIAEENGNQNVRGVVEGDDGLFTMTGESPTKEDFEALGLKIKLEVHPDVTTASFCGLVFDPEDCINVTDPMKMLIAMGWTSAKYVGVRSSKMKGLLRSKAMSVAYQYPGCPILGHAARAYMRLTSGIDTTWVENQMDWWQRERLAQQNGDVPWADPPMNTRLLVEKLYNITVQDQLAIESYLDSLTDLGPLYLPFSGQWPTDWVEYWDAYTTEINVRSREVVEEIRLHEMLPGYQPGRPITVMPYTGEQDPDYEPMRYRSIHRPTRGG